MSTILRNKNSNSMVITDFEVDTLKEFPAGVYEMGYARDPFNDKDIPTFKEICPDNDKPLEIQESVKVIHKEIKEFLGKGDIFRKYGFAHKRGYLLHGPPGCGKSTTLRLIEKDFTDNFNGITLIWRSNPFDSHYEAIRKVAPDRPVLVVCEDIDGLLHKFERYMLEMLDGQKALNNLVLIATTNYLDNIPSRIKDRPSRIDRVIVINPPSESERFEYLSSIGLETTTSADIAKRTAGLSIAQLKEVVISSVCFDSSIKESVSRLKKLGDIAEPGIKNGPETDDIDMPLFRLKKNFQA